MIKTIPITESIAFEEALTVLRDKGTLIYPTETCYGLGCDARDEAAVNRIFEIKEREKDKSVLIIAHDMSVLLQYIEWNSVIDNLARTYWPGALTIVASTKINNGTNLASGVLGSDHTIAFRVTSHPFASKLARELGAPIVSTSANISSLASPYDIAYIREMFEGKTATPDLIVDAGDLPHCSPSTIVRVDSDGTLTVLRQGDLVVN